MTYQTLMVDDGGILRIGEYGPLIKLRPPHTVESVQASAAYAELHRPWLCRVLKWHRQEVIGDLYVVEGEGVWSSMYALASLMSDTEALMRCKRCGAVREKKRFPG